MNRKENNETIPQCMTPLVFIVYYKLSQNNVMVSKEKRLEVVF